MLQVHRFLKRLWKQILSGARAGTPLPIGLGARARQRADIRYQSQRNLRNWGFRKAYLDLSPLGGGLFIHIPKTAGTAVACELEQSLGFQWIEPSSPPLTNRLLIPHYSLDWMIENQVLSQGFVESVPVFTVVRHPETRAISAYAYLQKMGHAPTWWSFERFLAYLAWEDPVPGGAQVSRLLHAGKQVRWITISNASKPVEVFRQESLGDLSPWISGVFASRFKIESKATRADTLTSLLNEKTRKRIRDFYAADFASLGYGAG